jgi:L-alanine-DL-glutamate epimerase-like enolase superfamily enzyme
MDLSRLGASTPPLCPRCTGLAPNQVLVKLARRAFVEALLQPVDHSLVRQPAHQDVDVSLFAGSDDLFEQFADRGFKAAKLKGGRDLDRDIPRLEIARDILSRNARRPAIMLDVNESWNLAQAARNVAAIEERMDLTWIEEPPRRWDAAGMAALRGKMRTAIATGENLTGLEQYRPLLDANAVDIVQAGNVWGSPTFFA